MRVLRDSIDFETTLEVLSYTVGCNKRLLNREGVTSPDLKDADDGGFEGIYLCTDVVAAAVA